ncbi:PlxyGVORF11-like protein [Hyphantria cunea granulovirus]|uniref:PlxyGVORF11-like protein n=1 Tax=Hyphantria cunea granulovirus TaxID=307448 RepID=A0AAE6D0K2_9BBAC|nr:PlxyGVORF11-like protein [Hyphantria cunea granulovirus]QBQ01560.1 PlxyGVORF11-like protein [Hyphantria cunea granulovirus]
MFNFIKANTGSEVSLVFQFAHNCDSIIEFYYAFGVFDQQHNRMVTGMDVNKPINCKFTLIKEATDSLANNTANNTYVLSVLRTDRLLPDLINNLKQPVVAQVLAIQEQPQIWYILGVKKVYEAVASRTIVRVKIANGEEIEKELFRISGGIPADLIRAFNTLKIKNPHYLQTLCLRGAPVDNSKVTVFKTN